MYSERIQKSSIYMKEKILNLETVHQCNCCMGNKTLHPLVSAIDLSKANLTERTLKFDFYTILLIEGQAEDFMCGRKYYDYSNATMIFLTPGQSINMRENKVSPQKGWLLAFHPTLLYGTSLDEHIDKYTFLFYQLNESLHLSLREKTKAIECIYNIEQELKHAIDCHSKTLISRYIELLLDYCSRFYERQFITRNEVNKMILNQTDNFLVEYIEMGQLKSKGLPSMEYCGEIFHLSPHYFNDLLKIETGKSSDEYFQFKRIEAAKKMLLNGKLTVSQISDELGFPSVQYFSRLFRKMLGISPNEYQLSQN